MSRPVITAVPSGPLTKEEVKFWLDIMKEHALFIKLGLPADNGELIREAESFYKDIGRLENRAEKVTGEKQYYRFIADTMDVLREFLRFKRHLVHQMLECKVGGCNPPLMIDHMAREAEYVLVLLGKIAQEAKKAHLSKTREMVFWLRLMADHTKLIRGRIDPMERAIVHTVDDLSNEFDDLFLEANDFYSMLTHASQLPPAGKKVKFSLYGLMPHHTVPAYDRFLHDVRSSVCRLRDFKKALYKMTVDCRMVSILPSLLADHVRREADHFLMVLAMIEKDMINTTGDYAEPFYTYGSDPDHCDAAEVLSGEAATDDGCHYHGGEAHIGDGADMDDFDDDDDRDSPGSSPDTDTEDDDDDEDDDELICGADSDDDDDDEDDDDDRLPYRPHPAKIQPSVAVTEKLPLPAAEPDETKKETKKDGQYKWSGKWPRPLGKSGE